MTTPHLDRIDSIRGMAILLVLGFHTLLIIFPDFLLKTYGENGLLEIGSLSALLLYFNPFGQGSLGVDLFLVISGFLIHLIHLRSGVKLNLRIFFSKRFWRIYPPYFIILLFFFFMNMDLSPQGIKNIISHVLLVHNMSDETFFSINPSFWSIALECQLYLIYPVYLFLLKYLGAVRALAIVVVMNIVFSTYGLFSGISSVAYGTFVLKFWMIWCAGAFLADRFYNNKRIFSYPFIWVLFSYLMYCFFKSYFFSSKFILIPATIVCLSLFEGMLYYKNEQSFLSRIVFKQMAFLGLCSYSIYLIHQPYLGFLISFYNPGTRFQFLNAATGIVLTWVTIILISYLLYKTLELASIGYGKKLRNSNNVANKSL